MRDAFKRIRAAYRRFNWCVEDLFCDISYQSRFPVLCVVSLLVMIPGIVVFVLLDNADKTIFSGLAILITLCLIVYLFLRFRGSILRSAKEEETQDQLQWKPENLQRFRGRNNTANNEILDFDRFNLPTIYSAVDRWQYVHNERVWLEKKLTPLDLIFVEFQAEFAGEGKKKRYTAFNYYFKKGRHYFKVTDTKGQFTVQSVYYEGNNPDFEMGEYLPKETNEMSYTANTIYTVLMNAKRNPPGHIPKGE